MQTFLALIIGGAVSCIVFVMGRVLTGAGSARDKSLSESADADIIDEASHHSTAS
jgi:hypothetical protein